MINLQNMVVANLRFDACGGVNYLYDTSFHLLHEDRKTAPAAEVEFEPHMLSSADEYSKICGEILKRPGQLIEFRKFSSGLDLYINMTRVLSKMTQYYSAQVQHYEFFRKVLSSCLEFLRTSPAEAESASKQSDSKYDKATCLHCKKFLCYNPKLGQLEYPTTSYNCKYFTHLKCEEERSMRHLAASQL